MNTGGRVRILNLVTNGLAGPIPPDIGALTKLESLGLADNNLTGPIPPEIAKLLELKVLWLHLNNLTGEIPPDIGTLTNLESLLLALNNLTGPIPPQLGNLINLRTLVLADNALTGPIPPELGNLIELTHLWLQGIALTGPIPLELRNLTALKSFLYYNTSLCVPDDDSFRTWLNNIPDHQGTGVDCKASSGFRDDFSSSASLFNWTLKGARATISDGALSLTEDSTSCASAFRDHDGKGWDVKELRMRAASTESIGLVVLRFDVDEVGPKGV